MCSPGLVCEAAFVKRLGQRKAMLMDKGQKQFKTKEEAIAAFLLWEATWRGERPCEE